MPVATAAATPAATVAASTEPTAEITQAAEPEATPKPVLTHSKTTVIYIRNNTFVPQEMMVLPGTGITWINEDKTVHSVKTLPDIGIKFVSGEIVPGATFGYTFSEKEGTYGFIDPTTNATGMIIVKKGESVLGAPKVQTPTATATP
jgi:plastocyanin